MLRRKVELNDNDELMRRCRKVRDKLNRRYNTVDKLWAYLMSLENQAGGRRTARCSARRARGLRAGNGFVGEVDPPRRKVKLNDNDEIMCRCRKAREYLNRRFPTLAAYSAYLQGLEAPDNGKRTARRTVRRAAAKRPATTTACRAVR